MSVSGLIKVDKSVGWTSFDAVNKLRATLEHGQRELTGERKRMKVGHSGTLDPFASGLLLIAYGSCTKKLSELLKHDKKYIATLRLGAGSTTGDPEGEITEVESPVIAENEVIKVLESFKGEITQTPPSYSAIKIDGVAAYKRARKGEEVKIEPRQVTIHSIELLEFSDKFIKFETKVSSGTYIRTLGEDIANKLGTKGYLTELERTEIGDYQLVDAIDPAAASYQEILDSTLSC